VFPSGDRPVFDLGRLFLVLCSFFFPWRLCNSFFFCRRVLGSSPRFPLDRPFFPSLRSHFRTWTVFFFLGIFCPRRRSLPFGFPHPGKTRCSFPQGVNLLNFPFFFCKVLVYFPRGNRREGPFHFFDKRGPPSSSFFPPTMWWLRYFSLPRLRRLLLLPVPFCFLDGGPPPRPAPFFFFSFLRPIPFLKRGVFWWSPEQSLRLSFFSRQPCFFSPWPYLVSLFASPPFLINRRDDQESGVSPEMNGLHSSSFRAKLFL